MTEANTLNNLKTARQRLIEYGWIQGDYGNQDTGFCAVGAVRHACHGAWEAAYSLEELRKNMKGPFLSVVGFNDSPLTDKVAVLDLFDRTIARLEQAT